LNPSFPIADHFAWASPFNYAENDPVGHIDLWGLQQALPDPFGNNEKSSTHTVKNGDTFNGIADQLGVGRDAFKQANSQVKNINHIEPGDKLAIPQASPSSASNTPRIGPNPFDVTPSSLPNLLPQSNSFLKNKAFEFGYSGALGGGYGLGLGIVFDKNGDWGVYGTAKVILGIGFSAGLDVIDINSTEADGFQVNDFNGVDVEYNVGLGAFGAAWGGNQGRNGENFTNFGQNGYTKGTFSFDPSGVKVRPKLKFKLSAVASWEKSSTKVLYNSRN
jgi:murein DD-endopeptidase MepM/ murein hydrolase activator NlpD